VDIVKQVIIIVSCVFLLFADLAVAEVWVDDFEGDTLDEKWIPIQWVPFANEPWDWKVESGVLKGRWPNWNGQFLFLKEYPSLDYTMQVRCRIDRLLQLHQYSGGGFVFRASGTGVEPGDRIEPFYSFGINDFIARFAVGGPLEFRIPTVGNYGLDQWHTLKLLVKNNDFLAYVDDEPVCELRDHRYDGKFVGLCMGCHTYASFDDFMITDQVDEDALSKAFGVSPDDMALATTWADLKVW
jgi:hypothetical protein